MEHVKNARVTSKSYSFAKKNRRGLNLFSNSRRRLEPNDAMNDMLEKNYRESTEGVKLCSFLITNISLYLKYYSSENSKKLKLKRVILKYKLQALI